MSQTRNPVIKFCVLFLVMPAMSISCTTMDWNAFGQGLSNALASTQSQSTSQYSYNYASLEGCAVVASNGQYLGKITRFIHSNSIFNEYGKYGSSYSNTSIWNSHGNYGSKYSSQSPFNPYITNPPKIIRNGSVVAYITVNENIANAINPYALKAYFTK